MTCSHCGRKLTDSDLGHLVYPAFGLYLCDLCNEKAEQCSPDDSGMEETDEIPAD